MIDPAAQDEPSNYPGMTLDGDELHAIRVVVEHYGRVWGKTEAYYRVAELLGLEESA
jgi:hypothetical protein